MMTNITSNETPKKCAVYVIMERVTLWGAAGIGLANLYSPSSLAEFPKVNISFFFDKQEAATAVLDKLIKLETSVEKLDVKAFRFYVKDNKLQRIISLISSHHEGVLSNEHMIHLFEKAMGVFFEKEKQPDQGRAFFDKLGTLEEQNSNFKKHFWEVVKKAATDDCTEEEMWIALYDSFIEIYTNLSGCGLFDEWKGSKL